MEIIAVHPNLKEILRNPQVTANFVMGQKLASPVNVVREINLKVPVSE